MMGLKIESLELERFRAFRALKVDGLGRVNLITGKNNTGKSSLLEALRILMSNAAPMEIHRILSYREENMDEVHEERPEDAESLFLALSVLFNGFPRFSESPSPIVISTTGDSGSVKLTLELGWAYEKIDEEGNRRLVEQPGFFADESEAVMVLAVEAGNTRRLTRLSRIIPYRMRTMRPYWVGGSGGRMPCIFVSAYGGEQTNTLAHLWDRIALSNHEEDVIGALKIIDRNISAVSMVGKEGYRGFRIAKVRADNVARPVPLRSYGDGLNRLFGIILSLVNAGDGLLLIDEFENGIHHAVQGKAWEIVFELATKLDVQVFATSHSWDTIEAFQKAAADTPEEGALIRLTRKDDEVIPTVFSEEELAVATRDRIEVR